MHRLEWAAKIFPGACFHLDKDKCIAITADEINLTPMPAAKVTIKDFVAAPAEMARSQLFPARAEREMLGAASRPGKAERDFHAGWRRFEARGIRLGWRIISAI